MSDILGLFWTTLPTLQSDVIYERSPTELNQVHRKEWLRDFVPIISESIHKENRYFKI